jgi:beta-phosphoglucomutase-like phosphatase (HAD superfamily)
VLVIFDCDGVLVDSEPLSNQSFSRALKPHGLDWSVEETMRRLMGRSLKSCVEIVEAEIGRKLPDDFVESMQAVTYQSFRDAPLQPVPGVKDAILAVQKAGLATCVASSGSPEKMKFTLGLTGLWELFEGRIFSASQVPRGKPFPPISSCMRRAS